MGAVIMEMDLAMKFATAIWADPLDTSVNFDMVKLRNWGLLRMDNETVMDEEAG